jgi:hypothetical protein
MDRQIFQLQVDRQSEQKSQKAEDNTYKQESVTVQATNKRDCGQIRQLQRGFSANFTGSSRLCGSQGRKQQGGQPNRCDASASKNATRTNKAL